jgi:signal transduction histidine kinase
MVMNPEEGLLGAVERFSIVTQEEKRLNALKTSGLIEAEGVPFFDEATQTAAHVLEMPIAILSILDHECQRFKSAVGLSRIGLMNDLAILRQLPRAQSLCNQVVESRRMLQIEDLQQHPDYQGSLLVKRYGIRSYLGVPLCDRNGYCLGTLEVMALEPRCLSSKDVTFLELLAHWSLSEFDRQQLLSDRSSTPSEPTQNDDFLPRPNSLEPTISPSGLMNTPDAMTTHYGVKSELIAHMTQELSTPLTSIMGMTSMLKREIYGPLTEKQKEYIEIVHHSGQYLLSLVNEIIELGSLDDRPSSLNLTPVDVEMLCQQALNTLKEAALRRDLQMQLSVEPGPRIWLLDKDKVRQILYHLLFSIIQASSADSIIRVHISRKPRQLHLTIWTSHPWFGEGLPQLDFDGSDWYSGQLPLRSLESDESEAMLPSRRSPSSSTLETSPTTDENAIVMALTANAAELEPSRQNLGLQLSRELIRMHGGEIRIQGTATSGFRYVMLLPQISETNVGE